MTVGELRDKLSQFDQKMRVVIYSEEPTQSFLEIDEISAQSGTPKRLGNGEASFRFSRDGPECWLFISVSPA